MREREYQIISVRLARPDYALVRGQALAAGKALSAYVADAAVARALESPAQPAREELSK